jgi:hypothetical protein
MRRRQALHVRNATVGARGNELGRQRRTLLQDIRTYQRQNSQPRPESRAPGTAPQGPRSIPHCHPPHQAMSPAPPPPPRPSALAVASYSQRMQNQNPPVSSMARPTTYQQPMPLQMPPPQQNSYLHYAPHIVKREPGPNPAYQAQAPFQHPQDRPFGQQPSNYTVYTRNGLTANPPMYPPIYQPSAIPHSQAPPGHTLRGHDSYRPGVITSDGDGDFYRPRYDGARQLAQLSAENNAPSYALHPPAGPPQANGQHQGPALPASNLGRRRSSQVYEPSYANIAVPRFGVAPTPAPRVDPQALQPIQNILNSREQEQQKAKRSKFFPLSRM